jgi:tetratricopeptide (TPR) repeat protein
MLLLFAGIASAQTVQAQPADVPTSPEARADVLQKEIGASQAAPAASTLFGHLQGVELYLTRPDYLSRLESLAESVDEPLVRQRVLKAWTRARIDTHDTSVGPRGMEGPLAKQGCMTNWSVVGPFDNDSMQGFEERLGPETDAPGPYEGKMTRVVWRELPPVDQLCTLRLNQTVSPNTSAVTYLSGTVEVDRTQTARLLVGARGAYRVWVNGELVGEQTSDLGLTVDNQAWRVRLNRGSNRVLVKLASQSDSGFAWTSRLVDRQLEPLDVEMTGRPKAHATAAPEEAPTPETTGDGMLARAEACANSGEPTTRALCAIQWRNSTSGLAATPWRSVAQELLAPLRKTDDPTDVTTKLDGYTVARLGQLLEGHARHIKAAEWGAALSPENPWIELHRAGTYAHALGAENRVRERRVLRDLLDEHPDFWPARLKLVGWYLRHDFGAKAHRTLEAGDWTKADQRPAYVRQALAVAREVDSLKRIRKLQEQYWNIAAGTSSWPRTKLERLTAEGRTDEALAWIEQQRTRQPMSTWWLKRQVSLMRQSADEPPLFEEALVDKRPGDVSLHLYYAELLAAQGRNDQASKVLERAAALAPQNDQVETLASFLQPRERGFHASWMVEPEKLRSMAESADAHRHSYDTLVDQTVVRVSANGLYEKVVQKVERVNTSQGISGARGVSVSHQAGDEVVEVIDVRVHKSDGTVLEDYDQWRTESRGGGSYYTDRAYMNLRANNVDPGDLVEFRYKIRQVANENFRGDYFGDVTFTQSTRPLALGRYVVEAPEAWKLHFRKPDLQHNKVSARPGDAEAPEGFTVQGFEWTDAPAVQTDPNMPGYTDVYDYIVVSNKKSWDAVGRWWWNLIEEQLIVNDAIANKVDTLTRGPTSRRGKLEAIHNWVVKNTRYLHVGLGIHGWKPYKTTACFNNKYGDCKDKAALLKVMLEEAGIPTQLVLVRTRRMGHVTDVPPNMHIFNHAIDYIPSMDLYLDPTAEFNGTTQLTPMDQGAQALVIEDGGNARFVTLPVDDPEANRTEVSYEISLEGDQTTTKGTWTAYGQKAVELRQALQDPERRDETFEKQLTNRFSGAELKEASYTNLTELEKPTKIEFTFTGGRIERSSGGQPYVVPFAAPRDFLQTWASQPERSQDRKISYPRKGVATLRLDPGEGRRFASIPEPVSYENDFASASLDFRRDGRALVVDISYAIKTQRVPVEQYSAFRNIMSDITSAFSQTIPIEEAE